LCGLSLQVKRLHDTNHSGWWYFLGLIPIVGPFLGLIPIVGPFQLYIWLFLLYLGPLYILYLMIKKSDELSNRYGDNPLNRE
jgi:uncharacterized membrane protein YhaH (DUF805 family)